MRTAGTVARLGAAGLAVMLAGPLAGPLAGCTAWAPEHVAAEIPAAPDPAGTRVPELRLIEAAERAERALASLARALPAPDAASAMPALDSVPAALRRPVTLDWVGPLEGLARALAKRAGWRFLMAGRPPARPLIVAVEAEDRPLIAVLRDAGLRAGGAATLTVDAAAQTVLLDWALVPGTASAPSATPGGGG